MSWSIGYDLRWRRDIGYGVPATCDFPKCGARIDRGLSYVCGDAPKGGERGCGLYFCAKHHDHTRHRLCYRCSRGRAPFKPTPDVEEWIVHKERDPSWAEWRNEIVRAQHDETGRMWEGPRSQIPRRYWEVGPVNAEDGP